MGPESIARLVDAKKAVVQAQNHLTATRITEKMPAQDRAYDLEDQYARSGLSLEDKTRVGAMLQGQLSGLLRTLWESDPREAIQTPGQLVKRLQAPGFVALRLVRLTDEAKGTIRLTDEQEYWGLRTQAPDDITTSMMEVPSSPMSHAFLEDDIHTVAQIYEALGIDLPKSASAQ